MNYCCEKCFYSTYLKNIIKSNNNKGNCNFCGSSGVYIYITTNFYNIFSNLLDLYIKSEKGDYIEKQLNNDFPNKVFSKKLKLKTKDLLYSILGEDIDLFKELLENKIHLKHVLFPERYGINYNFESSWDKFIEEIRYKNRFHIESKLDLERLEILFSELKTKLYKDTILYRARKSEIDGYTKDKMGKPPEDKANPGRANPKGIPYLYLAESIKTTLYEIRASLLDYVTVGTFILKEDIEILDFRNDIMLLADNENLEDFLIYKSFLNKLDAELSKPYNSNDREIDYLPTQYISEFIKSLGYKGFIYSSGLNHGGYNLVVFDGNEFECGGLNIFSVDNIDFSYSVVS